MKIFKIIFSIFLTAILIGIAIPKLTVRDVISLTAEEKSCVQANIWQQFDHPLQRVALWLGKSAVINRQGDGIIKEKTLFVKSYTIFRIPLPNTRIFNQFTQHMICDWASEKVAREVKTFEHWQCLQTFPSELCSMFVTEERKKLYADCAVAEIPKTADDTSLYYDQKIAVVRWWDTKIQDNKTLYLPYEPERDFAGCSESARTILKHLYETHRGLIQ